ncbi:hypothetical protein FRC04_005967 [Tulasnella sp. 424]|nr:hypothetical protein FRC04_005967 [Tulasnella sp. 424]
MAPVPSKVPRQTEPLPLVKTAAPRRAGLRASADQWLTAQQQQIATSFTEKKAEKTNRIQVKKHPAASSRKGRKLH